MRYSEIPKSLIEETKKIIRFHHFLRYDCGLKVVDKLSVKQLKSLLTILGKTKQKFLKIHS